MSSPQKTDNPQISIVMAVYNGETTVALAIESIINQSFTDFEFIIIDDGSKDNTAEILKNYAQKDERIKIYTRENEGLTRALNFGLSVARGKYIARQDADDYALPTRLQKQFEFMESNPDTGLSGSTSEDIYPDGHKQTWAWHNCEILQNIVFVKTPFPHSTAIMRTDIARALGGYDNTFRTSQDMEFWMRFAKHGMIGMIDEPLIRRGISNSSITYKRRWRQFYDALRARWKHNPSCAALYYSLRGLIINLMPHDLIRTLKKISGR